MGTSNVSMAKDAESRRRFLKELLHDVEALERMMAEGMIESGITRIGAEQEFCLIDRYYKPSKNALNVLERIDDPHFTSELARYNLEINLDPQELRGDCFSQVEAQLISLLRKAEAVAEESGEKIVLTGILPSIDIRAVEMEYITPKTRYIALANAISELRGGDFELNITGVDELILKHHNILFEACNTSFQCHYQVQPEEFADRYNWAQMLSGPVLSVCANSPLLLGRQLWAETRIALFQQSIDTRGSTPHLREREQRVTFGNRWIRDVADVFKNDIARHTLFFLTDIHQNSLEALDRGEIPGLHALQLHNGTVYKWNRPCYGTGGGVPHLRIENRYLPSGPTAKDEIANFAFWVGLMSCLPDRFRGRWEEHSFEDAKENFYKAAMWGVQSGMVWEGELMSARRLILDRLLPMAEDGLRGMGVDEGDVARLLGVIGKRAEANATGARWTVTNYRSLRKKHSRDEAAVMLTALMHERRRGGGYVHEWGAATSSEVEHLQIQYDVVGNVMSTDLVTVREDDLLDLVLKIMEWRRIHHLPVEDEMGNLKGLVTMNHADRYLQERGEGSLAVVKDVMVTDLITIGPGDDIKYALLLMVDHKISSLPVVERGKLVGILTNNDARHLWSKMKGSRTE